MRRQPAGGDAVNDLVGGNPETVSADRSGGKTAASLFQPNPRHYCDESANSSIKVDRAPGHLPGRARQNHAARYDPAFVTTIAGGLSQVRHFGDDPALLRDAGTNQ